MTAELLQRRLDRLTLLVESLARQQTIKPWYSVGEFAKLVHKSDYTVRQWCNLGRIHATKSQGRCGPEHEWVISHEELLRYQQHRLLPMDARRNNYMKKIHK